MSQSPTSSIQSLLQGGASAHFAAPGVTANGSAAQAYQYRGDLDLAFLEMFRQLQQTVAVTAPQQLSVIEPPKQTQQARVDETPTATVESALKAGVQHTEIDEHHDAIRLKEPLGDKDAEFLEWLVSQTQQAPVVLPNGLPIPAWVAAQAMPTMNGTPTSFAGSQLSDQMTELVKQAAKTGRAIRVPLQNQVEVILKIRHGQVSAEFLTPEYSPTLQQTVAQLRQHLASKQLPVGNIDYRQQQQQPRQQQHPAEPEEGHSEA